MDSNGKFQTTSEKSLPVPPPLPAHLNSIYCRQNLMRKGSTIRGSYSNAANISMDHLFDSGYRADVSILTDSGGVIYAHANILGVASPVLKSMLKRLKSRGRNGPKSISIHGVPPEAVQVFVRFIYSYHYEEDSIKEFALPLLVLSHAYAVPILKRLCERLLEHNLITTENAVDIFQFAMLCDAPRLSLICHRYILTNFKAVSGSEGWRVMKTSHPILEKEILESIIEEDMRQKERKRKLNEQKIYIQLYEAMEALIHIYKDGCRTIGPHNKSLKDNQEPCPYPACKGLETLIRHFTGCKMRGVGACTHCKRMWQILELHSRLCANCDACGVPLCRNFLERRRKQKKKEDVRWRILVKKVLRSKSITGAPFFLPESP